MITIGITILFLIISALLIFVLSRGRYVTLIQCEDSTQKESVESILSREGIPYKLSGDLTVTVLEVNRSSANLALGANNIRCAAYISDNDIQVEIKLKEDIISCFDEIKNAKINIYTLSNGEMYINILLELQSDLSPERIDYNEEKELFISIDDWFKDNLLEPEPCKNHEKVITFFKCESTLEMLER